jgi:hypothetical protein
MELVTPGYESRMKKNESPLKNHLELLGAQYMVVIYWGFCRSFCVWEQNHKCVHSQPHFWSMFIKRHILVTHFWRHTTRWFYYSSFRCLDPFRRFPTGISKLVSCPYLLLTVTSHKKGTISRLSVSAGSTTYLKRYVRYIDWHRNENALAAGTGSLVCHMYVELGVGHKTPVYITES